MADEAPRDLEVIRESVEIDGERYHTGYAGPSLHVSHDYVRPIAGPIPDRYDAADEGLVTPIKNQGSCGSCWAFARTKAFEAALLKAGFPVQTDLSEQDTLVNDRSAYGCGGGFMDGDYEVEKGQTTESVCPYRGSTRYRCSGAKLAKASRWALLGTRSRAPSDEELAAGIHAYGVLFVTVAAGSGFRPNSSGDITSCGSRSVNHMVALTAYEKRDGVYWFKIANSWGKGWGKDGYAWSKRGCNRLASTAGDAAGFFYFGELEHGHSIIRGDEG